MGETLWWNCFKFVGELLDSALVSLHHAGGLFHPVAAFVTCVSFSRHFTFSLVNSINTLEQNYFFALSLAAYLG